jgi:EmrB/QacA subfamily drug resistance transporter
MEQQHKSWTVLVLLCAAQFMVILDMTVVNVALPSIRTALGFAPTDLQWVVTAYVLATGGLLLLGGRLADLLGRRPVFLTGLALFTVASLTSGLASTPAMLVASRVGQGVGAALLSPSALSILTVTYDGEQRAKALSTWGALGGAGAAAGVLLGGILTTTLGWRSIFFINVPVGVLTAALAWRMLPRRASAGAALKELDVPGALALVAGLVSLVYGISGAGTHGWGSLHTVALFGAAAILLGAFLAIERRSGSPLVPAETWRIRSLVSSAGMMLGGTGLLVGTSFLNSLFFQNSLHYSALETGLAFLPGLLIVGVTAHLGPRLLMRVGARVMIASGLASLAVADLALSAASAHANYVTDLLPGLLLMGVGVGLVFVAVSVTAMSDIDHARAGLASGLLTTSHEIGGAAGVAVFSAVALSGASATLVSGYGTGLAVGAAVAAALAVVALFTVPAVRPAAGQRVALH